MAVRGFFSTPGPLVGAWALVLLVVFGGALTLELTYQDPSAPVLPEPTAEVRVPAQEPVQRTRPAVSGSEILQSEEAIAEAEVASEIQRSRRAAAGLTESSEYGPLPRRAADGREPWQVYARPFAVDPSTSYIAIIITGLGLNRSVTDSAIDLLPPEVTLAFSPYGSHLDVYTRQAAETGHETLLMVPMEPLEYPNDDPGPETLLTSLSPKDNRERLHKVMASFTGYVGAINDMGSRFTASREAIEPVLSELRSRGVMFVDARTTRFTVAARSADSLGTVRAFNNRFIDNTAAAESIDRQLEDLETLAKAVGFAVGIGRAYPVTIERVIAWSDLLAQKDIELAPITAAANRQIINQ